MESNSAEDAGIFDIGAGRETDCDVRLDAIGNEAYSGNWAVNNVLASNVNVYTFTYLGSGVAAASSLVAIFSDCHCCRSKLLGGESSEDSRGAEGACILGSGSCRGGER